MATREPADTGVKLRRPQWIAPHPAEQGRPRPENLGSCPMICEVRCCALRSKEGHHEPNHLIGRMRVTSGAKSPGWTAARPSPKTSMRRQAQALTGL